LNFELNSGEDQDKFFNLDLDPVAQN